MAGIGAAMRALADQLDGDGITATADPSVAASNRPCLLVTPPTVDYSQLTNTWHVMALSRHPAGTLDAVDELEPLVERARERLHVEHLKPVQYPLTPETGTVPALALRVVT